MLGWVALRSTGRYRHGFCFGAYTTQLGIRILVLSEVFLVYVFNLDHYMIFG